MGSTRQCEICGASFTVHPSDLKNRPCRTCSNECAGLLRARDGILAKANNPRWKGGFSSVERQQRYCKSQKAKGLCCKCGTNPTIADSVFCKTCLERHANMSRAANRKAKTDAFDHYGRTCVCCGRAFEDVFLTLNHVNNDGAEHRRKVGRNMHYWARRNGYPAILETNCWNCNGAKLVNGGACPCKRGIAAHV
jgi:hypothetical protein